MTTDEVEQLRSRLLRLSGDLANLMASLRLSPHGGVALIV